MKRYIFFLRHYNDIDNIAPAIYFFLKQDADNFATVILYDEKYDYKNDENLELLRNSFPRQYEQKWLGDLFGIPHSAANRRYKSKSTIKKVLSFVEKKLFINLKKVIKKSRIIEKVYRNKHDMHKIRTGNVEIQYICDNIKNTIKCPENPSLVVFDVVRYGMVSGLVDALHMMGIYNLVCLPVSPLINYNVLREDWMVDVYSDKFLREHDYSAFTALGYVDEYFYNSYEKLFDNLGLESTLKDKVVSLGS
ncbi:MAG: hypothetical protein SVR94_07330, partial [Pseudomonadota bacterium]|nr:hypothetical protein [Pseudomonadota bacterium]